MEKIKTLEQIVQEINIKEVKARRFIKRAFLNMPDNTKIKRLAKGCYVINFSDLLNNWDPEVYDFEYAAGLIIKKIESKSIESTINMLKDIVKDGVVVRGSYCIGRSSTYYVHPDIRKFINNQFFNGELEMKGGLMYPGERAEQIERKRQRNNKV